MITMLIAQLAACGDPANPPGTQIVDQPSSPPAGFAHQELEVLPPVEVTPAFAASIQEIWEAYMHLTDAMFEGAPDPAARAAGRLAAVVGSMDTTGLTPEATRAWLGHREVLLAALDSMAGGTPAEGKVHYSHVSEAIYCALRSFGGIGAPVFVAYCPMANDGKGAYWLSDSKRIRNPYMGAAQPGCGAVRETIGG